MSSTYFMHAIDLTMKTTTSLLFENKRKYVFFSLCSPVKPRVKRKKYIYRKREISSNSSSSFHMYLIFLWLFLFWWLLFTSSTKIKRKTTTQTNNENCDFASFSFWFGLLNNKLYVLYHFIRIEKENSNRTTLYKTAQQKLDIDRK